MVVVICVGVEVMGHRHRERNDKEMEWSTEGGRAEMVGEKVAWSVHRRDGGGGGERRREGVIRTDLRRVLIVRVKLLVH